MTAALAHTCPAGIVDHRGCAACRATAEVAARIVGGRTFDVTAPHVRAPHNSPLGTTVIRVHRGVATRWIKVRMDGPSFARWERFARWWWERNRGPVPAGKRIGHLDGDTLNDDPGNLAALDAADFTALWTERAAPEVLAAAEKRRIAAASAANGARARAGRAARVLKERWYPVDPARRVIVNRPFFTRHELYAAYGLELPVVRGNGLALGAVVGWRGLPFLAACILDALVELRGYRTVEELSTPVGMRRDDHGQESRFADASWADMFYRLRARGYVRSIRRGSRPSLYEVTLRALEERGPVPPVIAVYSERLRETRFHGWQRVAP